MNRRKDNKKTFYDDYMPGGSEAANDPFNDNPIRRSVGRSNYESAMNRVHEKADRERRESVAERENRLVNPAMWEDLNLQLSTKKEWLHSPALNDVTEILFAIRDASKTSGIEVSSGFISELSHVMSKLFSNADPSKGAGLASLITGHKVQDKAAKKIAERMKDKSNPLEEMRRGFKETGITVSSDFEKTLSCLAAGLRVERELPIKQDPRKSTRDSSTSPVNRSTSSTHCRPSPASTTEDEATSSDDEGRYYSSDDDLSKHRKSRR